MNFLFHKIAYTFLIITLGFSGTRALAQGKAPTQQPAQPAKPTAPAAAKPAAPPTAAQQAAQPAANTVPPPTTIPDVEPPNMPAAKVLGEVNALLSPADKIRRIDHFLFSYFEGHQKNFGKENVLALIKIRYKECPKAIDSCNNITDIVQSICTGVRVDEIEKFFWKAYFPADSTKTRSDYAKQLKHMGDLCSKVTIQDRQRLLLQILAVDLKGANRNLQDELIFQISQYRIKEFQHLDSLAQEFYSIRDQLQNISPTPLRLSVGLAEASLKWIDAPFSIKKEEDAQLLGAWMIFIADTLTSVGRSEKFAKVVDSHPEIFTQMRAADIVPIVRAYCDYWSFNGGAAKCEALLTQAEKKGAADAFVMNNLKYLRAWTLRAAGDYPKTQNLVKEVIATAKKNKDNGFIPWVLFLDALVKIELGKYPASQQGIQAMHSFWNENTRFWATYHLEGLEMLSLLKQGNYKEANDIGEVTLKKLDQKVSGETALALLIKFRQLVAITGLGQAEPAKTLHQQLIQKLGNAPDMLHLKHQADALMNRKNKSAMEGFLAQSAKLIGKNHPDQLAIVAFIDAINKKVP